MDTLHIIDEQKYVFTTICGIREPSEPPGYWWATIADIKESYLIREYELCKECAKHPEVLMVVLSNVGRVE